MSGVCNTNLPNFGQATCELEMGEVRRLFITSYLKEDGTRNYITKADAAALANWQTKINKWSFSTDKLEKVVPTCIIYGFKSEIEDDIMFNENGYVKKLADGSYQFTAVIYSREAAYIKSLKKIENNEVAVYLGDDGNVIFGETPSASDTDLYPYRLESIAISNFKIPDREGPSMSKIVCVLKDPQDANDTYGVEVADGDMFLDTDFYSLQDCTCTVTSPATTGAVMAIVNDRYNTAVTGLNDDVTDYLNWKFYDSVAPTVAIVPTATDKITESPDGTYTFNDTAIFTTGHVYTGKLELDGYDIASFTVTVP